MLNGRHLFLECHVGDNHNLCRLDRVLVPNVIVTSNSDASANIASVGLCIPVFFACDTLTFGF